jgi:ATP-dependent protease ClpP protease subunit
MDIYFQYTRNVDSQNPIMLIDRHIGGYDEEMGCYGIDGDQFARELMALDDMGKKNIDIWINSVGGNVMQGMSIYNAVLNTKAKVNTCNTGICASISAVIFQAGKKRSMADYSLLMFHNISGADSGETASKFNNSVATMISTRSGKTMEETLAMMDKTTWMSASEALMNGYCDEVTNSAAANKQRVSSSNDVKDNWKICAEITNSALNIINSQTQNNYKMSNLVTIANSLGLNTQASGEAIAEEIQKLKNIADLAKSTASIKDAEIEKITNSLNAANKAHKDAMEAKEAEIKALSDEKEKDILEIKNSYKAKEEKLERLEKEKEEELVKAQETNARTMVTNHAKLGRIENKVEIIDAWVDLAIKNGFEETDNLLTAIPLNKKAPVITVENNGQGNGITAAEMVANMRKARAK